ncbi:hypothetical protein [Natronobiforma cellulositropha]|uniref:hypothetical protein n=1 Tax=Natronobiforma cellulositropha TaxID=1679076 RepID=UPI0021D61438|nr:hypothetical protein [Natronobiforma cellulositropha]
MSLVSTIVGFFATILGLILALFAAFGRGIRRLVAKIDAFVPFGQLSGKILAVVVGLLVSGFIGGIITLIGIGVDSETVVEVGGYTTVIAGSAALIAGALFLLTWPLDQRGLIEAAIVKTGIRQRSRTSTGVIVALLGLVLALGIAYLLGYLVAAITGASTALMDLNRRLVGTTFVVVWVASSLALFFAFQKKNRSYIRTDLSILEIHTHEPELEGATDGGDPDDDGGVRELVVRNDSDDLVDLWKARIEDTDQEFYRLEIDMQLRPGEIGTLELPPGFSLETATYELPLGLDLFYDDTRSVSIYARSGDTFVLEWDGSSDVGETASARSN